MKRRCKDDPRYYERGICVLPQWANDFDAFYEYIGPQPSPKHSLDRINNDGNYEPGNVRWATASEQGTNRRPITVTAKRMQELLAKERMLDEIDRNPQYKQVAKFRETRPTKVAVL